MLTDPGMWLGLATLVLLEIVLGIDNLVFIAVLSDTVPSGYRDTARRIGLALALVVRLSLLAGVFWLTTLTQQLFSAFGHTFSGRDVILLAGGLFLLLKATVEIHNRLELKPFEERRAAVQTGFGAAIVQIAVLDAVFSFDSILTAVGMTNELGIMMAAVAIAMVLMLLASAALTELVNAHPPLIILCLGFLLMIGLSLVADGFGFQIPKGYLYAAIGFSVLIETFNQIALRNRRRRFAEELRRQRVRQTELPLRGEAPDGAFIAGTTELESLPGGRDSRVMSARQSPTSLPGALVPSARTVDSIMTPRVDVRWVDLDAPRDAMLRTVRDLPDAEFLVADGSIDHLIGVVRKQDLLDRSLAGEAIDLRETARAPISVCKGAPILKTVELFERAPVSIAVVMDQLGSLLGIVTQTDLLVAMADNLVECKAWRRQGAVSDPEMLLTGSR